MSDPALGNILHALLVTKKEPLFYRSRCRRLEMVLFL